MTAVLSHCNNTTNIYISKNKFANDTLICHLCSMPASKITFSEEDFTFIKQYKDATGVSLQRFVTVAVQEMIEKLKAEQILKDSPYTK